MLRIYTKLLYVIYKVIISRMVTALRVFCEA
jgi:hypothetical protein